ncbi:MAG: hypothetical protein QOI95_2099 [Acidimicrobiaceae bacterium]|jgi:hypothetical protein
MHDEARTPGAVAAPLLSRFRSRSEHDVHDIGSLAVAISKIPYGRPLASTADSVISSWRGTCSTKHILLRALAPEVERSVSIELFHRVYTLTQQDASRRWGDLVAATVPADGLTDVHTYARVTRPEGLPLTVDVTFPLPRWDGITSLPLACGEGRDQAAGNDPIRSKAALTARWCDAEAREPFIAALTRVHGAGPAHSPR